MHTIASLPPALLLAAITFFCIAAMGLALLLLRYASGVASKAPELVPVAAFLGTISTAWALSLGFAASDVWSLGSRADQASAWERSAVTRLLGIAEPNALDIPVMHSALLSYMHAVHNREWNDKGNRLSDPEVDAALQAVRLAIVGMTRQGVADPLIIKAAQDFDELQDARNERLAVGQSAVDETKWWLVLFLTGLSMVAIAVVHADRPGAGRNALIIFAIAAGFSMWILVLHANPYQDMSSPFAGLLDT
ncbi:DUF4239 domain-containing protein [Devosia limi]|uniref:DUF4239 domain-containing protein n=1 Tax=Devosia limi DSM 17137 TaxID=1121477 RepID=A0A1M4W2I9_9HYPH|nr:DUF4239 domain-containing protein [Devosia limi]SHE75481.1 Protein of unknown function [Devosia limi DSM 17137]